MQHIQNLPKGLDPEIVKQTQRGQGWGKEDQARYDAAIAKRGEAKERVENYKPRVENNYKPPTRGNNEGGPRTAVEPGGKPFTFSSTGKPFVKQGSTSSQNVNQQNGIDSTVTGDNNFVTNDQDNSIRYYGGNTTNFNYQGSGEGPDTPATMMTLAGIGKPQDSPADTARFIGKYSDLNSDAQKKYGNKAMNVSNKYIARAAQTNPIDYEALDKQVSQGIQQHYDRATSQQALYQGDVFDYKTPEFKMPKPPAEIESNVSSIADDYKDDLDDD